MEIQCANAQYLSWSRIMAIPLPSVATTRDIIVSINNLYYNLNNYTILDSRVGPDSGYPADT